MSEGAPSNRRTIWPFVVAAVVAGAVIIGYFVFQGIKAYTRPNPEFPSLADQPDPSLQGTVAYFDVTTSCVRIVAAAGAPSRDVLCITGEEQYASDRDTFGPLLAFLPDGRLQVSMFWFGERQPESAAEPRWQKIVDLTTGTVEEVATADLPSTLPSADPRPGPNGEQIAVTSRGGEVEIVLTDATGSRTLLSTKGNTDYTVKVAPTWSPDGRWIVVENGPGEILLITVDDPAVTRVLATNAMSWLGWSGRTSLAVTGAEFGASAG